MPEIREFSNAEAKQLLTVYSKRINDVLGHGVEIEIPPTEKTLSSLINNLNHINQHEKVPRIHVRLIRRGCRKSNERYLSNARTEIAYAREVLIPGEDNHDEVMRTIAEIVNPVHNCASTLGLRAAIDYDGRALGIHPALTFGGNFFDEQFEDVLKLLRTADTLVELHPKTQAYLEKVKRAYPSAYKSSKP